MDIQISTARGGDHPQSLSRFALPERHRPLYEGSMGYRASPLRMAQTSQARASVELGERTV